MKIEINNLCKSFSDKFIFNKFNLQLDSEKINCIVGESGGGKSTLLNILSGLIRSRLRRNNWHRRWGYKLYFSRGQASQLAYGKGKYGTVYL